MKVGDLIQPKATLYNDDRIDESWIGLVRAILDDPFGHSAEKTAIIFWNRKGFQAEEEYCSQLEIINESR